MNSQALLQRKQNLYHSNRKETIQKKLKQHRRAIIKSMDQLLMETIRKSETNLDQQTLDDIIRYANTGQADAIKQLGNLIIDNTQLAHYIGEKVYPFNADSWWWLIRILAVAGYISQPLLSMLIDRLKMDKRLSSAHTLEQIAETFAVLTEQPQFCQALVAQPQAVIAVAGLMDSPVQEICRPAYRLFSNIVANGYEETQQVIRLLERKLPYLMKMGLLKINVEIKLDVCMALTNLAINGKIIEELTELVVVRAQQDKVKVSRELSYYFAAAAHTASFDQLSRLMDCGLIVSIKQYVFGEGKAARHNGLLVVQTLLKRLSEAGEQGRAGFWQLAKMLQQQGLLSEIRKLLDLERLQASNDQVLEYLLTHSL